MRGLLLRLVSVCLLLSVPVVAQQVSEDRSVASIEADKVVVRLVVNDPQRRNVQTKAELLDVADKVVATDTRTNVPIGRGEKTLEFRLPLGKLAETANDGLAWYRLRYRIGDASGVVSLSQMIRDLFELRVIAPGEVMPGGTYAVRIRAVNPFTQQSVAGVKVTAAIELELKEDDDDNDDNDELKLNAAGNTDADGFAVLNFAIPLDPRLDGDADITVTGRRRGIVRTAEEDLSTPPNDVQVIVMADKPIYQPGQTVSLRGIVLKGSGAKTVLGGSEVEFRIEDDDNTLIYREKVVASEYGVAAIAWRIPSNAKLGDYGIEIRDSEGDKIGYHRVKISRYDLPNFAVTAKPSKPYYLPVDKEAEIEVGADYLFGKPVTKGKVRVVREKNREWNWKEQKYDIDEGEAREGEIDRAGKFLARFDLSEAHQELKDDRWDKFIDLRFAAYLTDLTTNKTEQRRFDVRVSREPVHVYLIGSGQMGTRGLTMQAYLSTFYADGAPAECDVEIHASLEDENKFRSVGRMRTNKFGAGKINIPRPSIGDPDDDLDFRFVAKDSGGRSGTHKDEVYFGDSDKRLRVTPDRTIYKPGDAVNIRIESTVKRGTAFVDIVAGWSVVESRFVELDNGRASLRIPYDPKFRGQLTVAAVTADPDDPDEEISTTAGIIYPFKTGIKVDASFDKAIYKPNDEATVKFGIRDVVGKAVESALGIVVFDKAVEERARTDGESGGMLQGLSGWLGYGNGFGSVNVKDLNDLDLTKPIPDEMHLVAEIILRDPYYNRDVFRSKQYHEEAKSIFSERVNRQMQPIAKALQRAYDQANFLHPTNDTSLRSILETYGIEFDQLRDPWGTAYTTHFSIDRSRDVLTVSSIGPDKKPGTRDDFTALSTGFEYFTPMGRVIETALVNYNARTGKLIRDEQTLFAELGVRELLDRFGNPYRLFTNSDGRFLELRLKSSGPDGKPAQNEWSGDDFFVWTHRIDLFAGTDRKIAAIQAGLKQIPLTEADFRTTLRSGGVNLDEFRDGNGHPLYINVGQRSRYWDNVKIETVRNFGSEASVERRTITPVTQQIVEFTIRSVGRDGKAETWDDVTFTQVVHVLSEQAKEAAKPVTVVRPISFTGSSGAIAGTVIDAAGAVIPGATVIAKNSVAGLERSTTTDDEGRYLVTNLPAGTYSVTVTAPNFKSSVIENVAIAGSSTTTVNVTLEAGAVSETVTVTSGAEAVQTTNTSVVSSVGVRTMTDLPLNTRDVLNLIALQPGTAGKGKAKTEGPDEFGTDQQTSTPRLREYFPETLYWAPEIVTAANGRAEVKFRMADNITTWKMYTIASTKDGKIGFGEKEVTAFQAFFVDLDPPKFLTTGDEIFLPTQVRNYTDKKQNVKVTMSPADWFGFLDGEAKQVAVDSGGSENAVFGFKALTPVKEGRQRVTATAAADADAIERPVTVRPDGREIVHTESRYFTGADKLEINFPANALPNTRSAELKIYPNLMAHVSESIEGLLKRPYGCGEQTISSTYPNVMILKFAGEGEGKPRRISEAVERKARKFLQSGYERLIGYQVSDGGFSYWGGKDTADFALTAYALRFLADASRFITVDPQVVSRAETWLVAQQRADGSWNKKYHWESAEDDKRAKLTTTYVARTLAMLKASDVKSATKSDALAKALSYLKARNAQIDDPYSLSLFGLAAFDAGDKATAQAVAQELATLAKTEGASLYWSLETNTAFNGWGAAGRIETTALVTQLFLKLNSNPDLVSRAMIFLIRSKDLYGVWYSTQTTINVLDALVLSMAGSEPGGGGSVQVLVNGRVVQTIEVPPDKLDQITVDLNGKLADERNVIELRTVSRSPMMAQAVGTHYISWNDADTSGRTVNQSRALRLDYKCDRTTAAVMDEVSCAVEAERVAYRGYGMLLAEIGTPPGADVSRESLQAAMDSDWSISRYDVLPDRIIIYMWSKAGGTKFNFKFRPRYAINAQTPASTVYDYYNPEAQATVAPLRFGVK